MRTLLCAAFAGTCLCLAAAYVRAADGAMLLVTANPGKIMSGDKVLAEVPAGTRLWRFSLSPDQQWAEVKVPRAEQHGWLLLSSTKLEVLNKQQLADRQRADELFRVGEKQETAQQFAAARASEEQSLTLLRRLYGEHPDVANRLVDLLALAYAQGDYPAARQYGDEALALQRKILGTEHRDTANSLKSLGVIAQEQDDFQTARKFSDEALAIYLRVLGTNHQETAGTLKNLGRLAVAQGNFPAAQNYYERALAIERKVLGNEDPETAKTLNNLGHLAFSQDDYPTARKYFEQALGILRKTLGNQDPATAMTLNNLGVVTSDLQAARQYYTEALAIRRKILGNEHPGTAETISNLGNLAFKEADYAAALRYEEEGLAIWRKVLGNEHPNTTKMLNNLGILAFTVRKPAVAARYFDQARHSVQRHVRRTLPGLSAAEQIAFLEHTDRKYWFTALSFGYGVRDQQELLATSGEWLLNRKAVAEEALAARELLLRDATNPATAPLVAELQTLRKALATLALSIPPSNQVAAQQAQLAKLSARELQLSQQLAQATGNPTNQTEWIELSQVRRALPRRAVYIDVVRLAIYDFKVGDYGPPHYVAWIIPAEGVGQLEVLDLGEAELIDAAVERARTQLAAAMKDGSTLRTAGEAAAAKTTQAELQAAATLVLQPLLPQLQNKTELLLSPDGALWLLPWAALPVDDTKCLLEQCSLRYVTSGRDLVRGKSTSKLGTTAPAIVVNPDYDLAGAAAKTAIKAVLPELKIDEATRGELNRSSLPRVAALPFTSFEGQGAKPSLEQLAQRKSVFYEQEQALEAVVKKLQRPKQLLLSTHGFFLPDQAAQPDKKLPPNHDTPPDANPLLRCGLLLAGCNQPRTPGLDDGILTGMEIVGMDLRGTELVVLSACETGIGRVRNGEGVAGLRQAFQLAGAQSVVSTLWQVPDRDSALIMQDFFANLAAGQTKADALRNAQLKRIAARKEKSGAAHPFFWAAWTVTGE